MFLEKIAPNKDFLIEVVNYNSEEMTKTVVQSVEECIAEIEDPKYVTWINIKGLSDSKAINKIGETFGIHALWLEDVLNTDHKMAGKAAKAHKNGLSSYGEYSRKLTGSVRSWTK